MACDTFTCTKCGGTYEKTRPDAVAMAEALEAFPECAGEELGLLCDTCYQQFTEWLASIRGG